MRIWTFVFSSLILFSGVSHAGNLEFTQQIYNTLDALETREDGRFEQAVSHLILAREQTQDRETQKLVEEAMESLVIKRGKTRFPTDPAIASALTNLKTALIRSRVDIGLSYPNEAELIEKLVLTYYFPAAPGRVSLTTENIDKKSAMILLQTYMADPARAVRHDPDVAMLVTGDGQDASAPTIKFIVADSPYEVASAQEASELKKEADAFSKLAFEDRGIPIRTAVQVDGSQAMMFLEVKGFRYMPLVESYLRDSLALGQGNRYIFKVANGLEWLAREANIAELGGNAKAQGFAKSVAQSVTSVEELLRMRLLSSRWYDPTSDRIKAKILRRSQDVIAHMTKNLEALKAAQVPADVIASETAKTAQWVSNQESKANKLIQGIDKAVAEASKAAGFEKLTTAQKSAVQLAAAEKAGKMKLLTIDRALKSVTFMVAAYHVYEWANQVSRAKRPEKKRELHEKYATKVVATLVYGVPVVGEAAVALDVGGWVAEKTLLKMIDSDYDVPNSEDMVHGLFKLSENAGYWSVGTTRFQVMLTEGLAGIPSMGKGVEGKRVDFALQKYQRTRLHFDLGEISDQDLAVARDEYQKHLKTISRKYLLLIHFLSDQVGPKLHIEMARLEKELDAELFERGKGYIRHAEASF